MSEDCSGVDMPLRLFRFEWKLHLSASGLTNLEIKKDSLQWLKLRVDVQASSFASFSAF